MAELQSIKNRFNIIGNSPALNFALNTAVQVANTELSVLIVGESGVGKEAFSQVIHALSARKHNSFIAVNCGAIPEGTIDSELFGHEKGAFTGAVDSRKGYFETVSGGTIFLDEIGEMPLSTQARLLRVLETGEFLRVGSSKVQKTDVRVIAATNKELFEASQNGKFREDLYFRLSTVPIRVPALRDRKEDIHLLFRKFVADFSEKYKTQSIQLTDDAKQILMDYSFPGNIRELKNIAEQISVLHHDNILDGFHIKNYLPERKNISKLPVLVGQNQSNLNDFSNEREILYKLFFDMKKDVTDLKKMFLEILQNPSLAGQAAKMTRDSLSSDILENSTVFNSNVGLSSLPHASNTPNYDNVQPVIIQHNDMNSHAFIEDEIMSLEQMERNLIERVLKKYKFRRRDAARELGISERTLYRKIKDYELEEE